MPDGIERPHPIEKTEELIEEAEEGRSARTPWLLVGGMQLFFLLVFLVIGGIVFTVYLLS